MVTLIGKSMTMKLHLTLVLLVVLQCEIAKTEKQQIDSHILPFNLKNPVGYVSGSLERDLLVLSFPSAVNTTLIFHELYENLSVTICEDDGTSLKMRLHVIPPTTTDLSPEYCDVVDPMKEPIQFTGPVPFFVQIARLPSSRIDSGRGYLKLLDDTRPVFNLTYAFQPGLVNHSLIEYHQPCEYNGIAELHRTEKGSYRYICNCLWNTRGERCQWGDECPENKEREACANRGSCRQRQNEKVCFCDEDHHGPSCAHYTWFKEDQRRSSEDCHYYHVLPVGSKCSCRPGYNLSPDGKCIEGVATLYFNFSLPDKLSKTDFLDTVINKIETCFPNISTGGFNVRSNMHVNENSWKLEVPSRKPRWSLVELRNINFTLAQEIAEPYLRNESKKQCDKSKRITREHNVPISKEVFLQKLHTTPSNIPFEPLSSSMEKYFLEVYCCHPGIVNFTFYKDNHVINEVPVNSLMRRNPVWSRDSISINIFGSKHFTSENGTCMCLKINNYDFEDLGEYHCKIQNEDLYSERYHYASSYWMSMELTPKTLTVNKGDNATVRCQITGVPMTNYTFNISWQVPSGKESYVEETTQLISKVHINNIQSDVIVKCEATEKPHLYSNKTGKYLEKAIRIRVVEENQSVCEDQHHVTGHWKMTLVDSQHVLRCPKRYHGTCQRMCYLHSDGKGIWATPDCSGCRNRDLYKVFKPVRMYRKGIHSYLKDMDDLFPKLAKALKSMETVLPGEMGNVLVWLKEAISKKEVPWTFDDFNDVLNSILWNKHSILQSDFGILREIFHIAQLKWAKEGCDKNYFKGRNLISFVEKKITALSHKIVLSLGEGKLDQSNRNIFDDTTTCTRPDIVQSKITLFLDDQQRNSSMISAHVFRRPSNVIAHLNVIHTGPENAEKRFGKVASPLVYLNLHSDENDDTKELKKSTHTSIQFQKCLENLPGYGNIKWSLRCGRYNMGGQFWNTSSCSLMRFSDGRCTCTCNSEKDDLVGLMCLKVNITRSVAPPSVNNGVVAFGSGISIGLLVMTSVVLSFECTLKTPESLPRLVEVLSLLVVHFVFFYESLVRTAQAEHLALLIAISAGFVLSLGISVSQQVSLLQKNPAINSTRPFNISMEPTLLVVIISILCSLMLGFILWTICTVQNISLSHTWLPDQSASILTLVVLCYICGLLLLLLILVAFNYLRVRKMQLEAHFYAKSLYAEYRNKCITNVFHFILILTSFYQENPIGRWFFLITCILQSGLLMVLYSRQTFCQLEKKFKRCCVSPNEVKRKELFEPMKKNASSSNGPARNITEPNSKRSISSRPSTSSSLSTNQETEMLELPPILPRSPIVKNSDEENPTASTQKSPSTSSSSTKFREIIYHNPPSEQIYYATETSKPVEGYLCLQPSAREKSIRNSKSVHPFGTYMNISPASRVPTERERSYTSVDAKSPSKKNTSRNVSPERSKQGPKNV